MKVALVTGGAHGIGEAIVRRLRADGYAVAAVDEQPADIQADISDPAQCRRAVEQVARHFGRLDVLVNNAGISQFTPLADETVEHWNKVIATNLTGPFVLSQAAAPLLAQAGGAIVNIASTRAVMSEAGTEAYSASKGGLVALTHALAVSLGPKVRVNCVSPGWIDVTGEALRPEDHSQHPAGRVGTPDDIAGLVAWLASRQAGFVTGAHWVVDGGMTRKMIYAE